MSQLNPVQEEIQKSSLNLRDGITAFYNGSYEKYEKVVELAKKIDQTFSDFEPHSIPELSRHRHFAEVLSYIKRERENQIHQDWHINEIPLQTNFYFPFQMSHAIHAIMCYPLVDVIGDKEQKNYFLPRMISGEIRTCYAQSELGHGSDVQNIETTANYHPKTKEFVFNSPSVTSTKW